MQILVTGGAGFVGSNLIKSLSKNTKLEITSLDNYFTGRPENHISGVKYVVGSTKDIFQKITFSPDVVYHFGEYSRVSTSFEDIEKVWEFNIEGTKEVVDFCLNKGSKLIYSASSTKFGDGGNNRFASPYALHKASNTDLIKSYHDWFGLKYAICYFYNVFGAGQISSGKYATVIGIFEEQYKNKVPLTVTSPGTQMRDFTHISDIVSGLEKLLSPEIEGDGYCFGTGESHSIMDIAKLFESDIAIIPSRKGERKETSIDLKRSREIGWNHTVRIRDYIAEIKNEKI